MSKDNKVISEGAASDGGRNDDEKVEKPGTSDGDSGAGGGEDDSSTEIEGDDSHLHEDQKSRKLEV